jgi:hypothetical protein
LGVNRGQRKMVDEKKPEVKKSSEMYLDNDIYSTYSNMSVQRYAGTENFKIVPIFSFW